MGDETRYNDDAAAVRDWERGPLRVSIELPFVQSATKLEHEPVRHTHETPFPILHERGLQIEKGLEVFHSMAA